MVHSATVDHFDFEGSPDSEVLKVHFAMVGCSGSEGMIVHNR